MPSVHPDAAQKVLSLDDKVFAVERTSTDGEQVILAASNLSSEEVDIAVSGPMKDLILDRKVDSKKALRLAPYQAVWLVK